MTRSLIQMGLALVSLSLVGLWGATEAAMVSVNHLEVRALAAQGRPRAALLDRLLANRGRVISHLLVGMNSATIIASVMVASLAEYWLGSQAIAVTAGLLVVIQMLLAEIIPKTLAYTAPLPAALRLAGAAAFASYLFGPVEALLGWWPRWLSRRTPEPQDDLAMSEESLTEIVRLGVEQGELSPESSEVVSGILAARDTKVAAVMAPWSQVVSVQAGTDLAGLVSAFSGSGLSRLPVVRPDGNPSGEVVGVLHVKDVFARLYHRRPGTAADMMRPVLHLGAEITASEALAEMRHRRQHLAVVVDHHSGPVGLVTIQDLLEDIVGQVSAPPPAGVAAGPD